MPARLAPTGVLAQPNGGTGQTGNLPAVALSGSYTDLTNKPTVATPSSLSSNDSSTLASTSFTNTKAIIYSLIFS